MTESDSLQHFKQSSQTKVDSASNPAQETNPGDSQIEGTPNEAPQDRAEQGAPSADGAVQTPEAGASAAEPLDKAAIITFLQEKKLVSADQAQLLKATSEKKAKLIAEYLEKEYFFAEDIGLLMLMTDEDLESQLKYTDRENQLKKESAVDQMIQDGVFNEADREGLLTLELKDIQEWSANWNDNRKEARQMLAFLRTGGEFDKAMAKILLPDVIKDVDKEFEDILVAEAEEAYKLHAAMAPEDVVQTIFIDENKNLLSKEAFLKSYIQDRKDPIKYPKLQEEIAARVQQELQKRVSELRGKSADSMSEVEESLPDESDPQQAEEVKELKKTMLEKMSSLGMFKDQLVIAVSEALDNLLSNTDLITIFRVFIHGNAAFEAGRGGTLGYEDGKMVRYVEEAELFAKFKKPQELGQALALAISRNKEMQAMKFTVSDELLQQAAEGDSAAVRKVMQEVVEHLHGGSNTDERWKALRQGLAEGLYPGVNARLDDDIKKMFMDDKGAEALRLLDLMMPKEGAGSSSKDDKSQQPANVTPISAANGSSSQGATASAATPE